MKKTVLLSVLLTVLLGSCQLTSLKDKPKARYIVATKTLTLVLNSLADAREAKLIKDNDWKNVKFANRQCKEAFIKWHYNLSQGESVNKTEQAAMLALKVLQDYNKTYKKGE